MTATPASGGTVQEEASGWAVSYAREEEPFEPPPDDRVRVQLLTDPWSVWCWGFEPIRRTLELRYPTIEFQPLVGGMFERLPTPEERGFDLDAFFTMVQRTTGMPITTQGLKRDRPASTYPACIHVHTVRLLDARLEERYLRALREAAYVDGLNVSEREVAAKVAEGLGIEAEGFHEALDSGEPEREFNERLAWLHSMDLVGYPTLLVTTQEGTARADGFQNIASVLNLVESVSGHVHPARPPPELDEVLPEGQRVATREVAEVLGCSMEQAYDQLLEAFEEDRLTRTRQPSGDLWARA